MEVEQNYHNAQHYISLGSPKKTKSVYIKKEPNFNLQQQQQITNDLNSKDSLSDFLREKQEKIAYINSLQQIEEIKNKPKSILKSVSRFDKRTGGAKPDSSDQIYGNRLKYQQQQNGSFSNQPKKISFNNQHQILSTPLLKNRQEKKKLQFQQSRYSNNGFKYSQNNMSGYNEQNENKNNEDNNNKQNGDNINENNSKEYFQINQNNNQNLRLNLNNDFDPFENLSKNNDISQQQTPNTQNYQMSSRINSIKNIYNQQQQQQQQQNNDNTSINKQQNNAYILNSEQSPKYSSAFYGFQYAQQNKQHQRINFENTEQNNNNLNNNQQTNNIQNNQQIKQQNAQSLPKINQNNKQQSNISFQNNYDHINGILQQQQQSLSLQNTERKQLLNNIPINQSLNNLNLNKNQHLLLNNKRYSNQQDSSIFQNVNNNLKFGNMILNQNNINNTFNGVSFRNKFYKQPDMTPQSQNIIQQSFTNQSNNTSFNNNNNLNNSYNNSNSKSFLRFSQSMGNFNALSQGQNILVFLQDNQLLRYDIDKNQIFKKKTDFPFSKFAQIQINGCIGSDNITPQILCTGGIDTYKQSAQDSAFIIDWHSKKIEPINSMISCRFSHVMVIVEDFVYAIGGRNINGVPQNWVEKLNLNNMNWTSIPNLQYKRTDLVVCANIRKKSIFVTGNPYIIESHLLFEKYDIQINQWSKIKIKLPDMLNTRHFFNEEINLKAIIPNTPGLQTKEQIYFFMTKPKSQECYSLLLEYEEDSQNSFVNKLTDITIFNKCHILIKSFHLYIINLENINQNSKYGIGNWQKQDLVFKHIQLNNNNK